MPKILVVEDEADNLELFLLILRRHGFETVSASNGMDGLTLAQVETPDAILLDLMLPDIKGEDFCGRLRHEKTTARLPIIAITAGNAPGVRERAMAAGANYYMAKPGNMAELVEQLHHLIEAS
jgi:CheY-like chemotaxis protein